MRAADGIHRADRALERRVARRHDGRARCVEGLSRLRPARPIVRDQSGFAGMLGLKNGDRVELANGIPLALPSDIASTVLQPLTKSQAVWVAGTRDGKPQQWLFLNAGACPG